MIRESVRTVLQGLVEFDAAGVIGAGRYERTDGRLTERNGSRPKLLATKGGDIELKIPELRKGSCLPCILEPAGASPRRGQEPGTAVDEASRVVVEAGRAAATTEERVSVVGGWSDY